MELTGLSIIGIHTGVGKTVCSSLIRKALNAYYFKPVQAGDLNNSDSIRVSKMSAADAEYILPEWVKLNEPASPHQAMRNEGRNYHLSQLEIPQGKYPLILETAGGLFSPFDEENTMLDLIKKAGFPVILVCNWYLGSINHSLLSFEVLKQHNIPFLGWVISGEENKNSEEFIVKKFGTEPLFRIPKFENEDSVNWDDLLVEVRESIYAKLGGKRS